MYVQINYVLPKPLHNYALQFTNSADEESLNGNLILVQEPFNFIKYLTSCSQYIIVFSIWKQNCTMKQQPCSGIQLYHST